MKTFLNLTFLFGCVLFSSQQLLSQEEAITDPVAQDFQQTTCPIEPSASAYYLFDHGKVSFNFDGDVPERTYERHFRIHILNTAALDYGDWTIPLYFGGQTSDKLFSIHASVFNVENNKVAETEWNKKDLIYENVDEKHQLAKMALPKVSAGSIIDVEYVIKRSGTYFIDDWYFQKEIPVLQSSYAIAAPEFLDFKSILKGYYKIDEKVTPRVAYLSNALTQSHAYQLFDVVYSVDSLRAFHHQPWLFCQDNYVSQVEFQLNVVRMPYRNPITLSKTWDDVADIYRQEDRIGRRLIRVNHLDKMVSTIKSSGLKDEALLRYACSVFSPKMKWDGVTADLSSDQLKVTFEKGLGNSADLNLNLIALLTELGFKSKMVLLSTQKHGYVYEEYPSPDLFDYIICEVTVGEKTMLLDATAPVIEANLLPERCLNGKGLVVDDKTFHWTNLLADQKYVVSVKHEVTLTSATEVSGKSRYEYAQLAKPQTRKKFLSDKETYIQSEEQSKPGLDITELTIDSVDTHCNKLVENVSFKINDVVKSYDDKIILPLTLCWGTLKNPLNSEERDYPVEMSFPYKSYDMIEIKIPDGYTVEQLPKSSAIQTADGGCKYSLTVIAENGLIKVVSAFNANKIFYEPQEFSMLHDFFDKMVEKDEEKVILKKI